MDFRADAQASAQEWLNRFGHKKAEGLSEPYLNFLYLRRYIPFPIPRRVMESREAKAHMKLLSDNERAGYELLKREASSGDRLLPRLTTQITKSWNSDFQTDWGLLHFHLGTAMDRKGFYKRSTYLAFAWVDAERFLIIALLSHKPGEDPWTDEQLLAILNKNWPEILRPYRGAFASVFPPFQGEERSKMREAGVMIMTEVNGQVYFPPGGGSTSARTPADAVMQYNSHLRELDEIQENWQRRHPADYTSKLHLLPFGEALIETDSGDLFFAKNRGQQFDRLESHRMQIYQYLLNLPDPFRAPRMLPT